MTNVKFLNPFVDAAAEVLKAEVQLSIRRGNLSLQKSAMTADDVTVLLSLVGQVQGVVMYGMSTTTALDLVSRMMGQEFTEFDNLAQSGVAELGNVITGRATIKLSEAGYQSNISPPTLIQGHSIQVSTLDFSRIVVPLMTESGQIVVNLALRESPPDSQDRNFVPISVP
ncbi:MAG TPA: chemotaxis protein CheX [Anaerolineaceae bacterium]|nr:chemotaxis protein CheX [Anaerolineaceae bacterium]HPN52544.1 chemotaxis protein CheX [Anaerolineaceae bacterium]